MKEGQDEIPPLCDTATGTASRKKRSGRLVFETMSGIRIRAVERDIGLSTDEQVSTV